MISLSSTEHCDDPVEAYSRVAPDYAEVEQIVSRIPPGNNSLL
jgi:hypothetical protein